MFGFVMALSTLSACYSFNSYPRLFSVPSDARAKRLVSTQNRHASSSAGDLLQDATHQASDDVLRHAQRGDTTHLPQVLPREGPPPPIKEKNKKAPAPRSLRKRLGAAARSQVLCCLPHTRSSPTEIRVILRIFLVLPSAWRREGRAGGPSADFGKMEAMRHASAVAHKCLFFAVATVSPNCSSIFRTELLVKEGLWSFRQREGNDKRGRFFTCALSICIPGPLWILLWRRSHVAIVDLSVRDMSFAGRGTNGGK